mmetsp:Transcript_7280/g.16520  ORF Transcript_7280/g.16520 Transcript_7280/m.16520 type:complete len:507 (-) Transcript_7280:59-1579(-)
MVFKRFTDRLISAGTTAANTLIHGPEQAEKIRQLESMGFSPERARHALNATEGDVDRAAELLLLGANEEQQQHDVPSHNNNATLAAIGNNHRNQTNNNHQGTAVAAHNDEQMRRAIDESMRANQREEARQLKEVIDLTGGDTHNNAAATKAKKNNAQQKKNNPAMKQPAKQPRGVKSAATINAGKAAATRHNNHHQNNYKTKTLDQTHPNVQLPEKLSNKSKEEQILRCAHRVKPHVMAVDTLLRVLTSVRNSPDNPKFRTIDRSNANYIKFVKEKTGAEDMLLAMNYRRVDGKDELRLERHLVDEALLYLGISALEQMRTSDEYMEGKRLRAFHAEMRRVAKQNGSEMQQNGMTEAETLIRLEFLSKCPKEPPEGRGAWMNVYLGDESENIEGSRVKRRFDGDDTLEDVLNWLGGCYGNEVLDKIRGTSREWCLCDLNRYPILPLDVEKHGKKTLQYLGLFPSGKFGVRLSDDAWRDRKESDLGEGFGIHGSARGLGAASRSMLH